MIGLSGAFDAEQMIRNIAVSIDAIRNSIAFMCVKPGLWQKAPTPYVMHLVSETGTELQPSGVIAEVDGKQLVVISPSHGKFELEWAKNDAANLNGFISALCEEETYVFQRTNPPESAKNSWKNSHDSIINFNAIYFSAHEGDIVRKEVGQLYMKALRQKK
ncbi:MAG: hypothetical protein P8Y47_11705 [Alphaproteobacteria bacterium]